MQKQRTLSAVGLWWRWVLATLVGAAIGNIFGIVFCLLGVNFLSEYIVAFGFCYTGFGNLTCPVATGIVSGSFFVGIFVGLMQYIFLRRFVKSAFWWILASGIGWTWIGFTSTSLAYTPQFGFVMGADGLFTESNIIDRIPQLAINSLWLLFAGLLLGGLQWLVIKNGAGVRLSPKRSLWWIAVNTVLIAFMAIAILYIFRGRGSLYGILMLFLEFTPFYATITAATLVKMNLHKSLNEESEKFS